MLEIKINGHVAKLRRPVFDDLVVFETARKGGADDFAAMVSLFKRLNEGSDAPPPKPIQVSSVSAAMRYAGEGATLVKLEEDDLSPATADLYVAAQEKCIPHAFGIVGNNDIQVVCKEPSSDVLQVYYKTMDSSVLRASRALCTWCLGVNSKPVAEATAKLLDEKCPAVYVALANALAEVGGMTAQAEIREL